MQQVTLQPQHPIAEQGDSKNGNRLFATPMVSKAPRINILFINPYTTGNKHIDRKILNELSITYTL